MIFKQKIKKLTIKSREEKLHDEKSVSKISGTIAVRLADRAGNRAEAEFEVVIK